MGNCLNADKRAKKKLLLRAFRQNEHLMTSMKTIGLEEYQLFELYLIFSSMDKDHSGEIDLMEFFEYVDLPRTRFSERAFSVMDKDGSGEVDFVEFVLAVWNYCTFSRSSLMRYAFDLYDIDGSGQMELFEVIRCVREIWGTRWNQNENAQKIVHKLEIILNEKTQEHSLSYHLFEDFAKRHPLLLFPAFQLQTDLQKAILGENFWIKAAKHRSKMSKHTGLLQWKHIEEMFQSSSVYSENVLRELDEKRLEDLVEKKIKVNQKEENNESMKTKTMKTSKSMTPMINVASSSPQAKGLHKSNSNIELKSKTTITNMSSTTENSTKTKKKKKKTTTITSNTTATSTSTSTFTSNVGAAAEEEEEVVVVTTTTTPITPIKPIPKTNTRTTSITANVLTKKPSEVIEVEKLQLEDLEEEEKFIPRDIVPSRLTVSSSKTKSIRK